MMPATWGSLWKIPSRKCWVEALETQPKINARLREIFDEVHGLRKPAAAFRHAACCERGKPQTS